MLYNAALVLEGGAFRGQYTAGVLDTFLDHHIEFDRVIGVSAGALCGANFVSKQYGRAEAINTVHRHDRHYISTTHLLRGNSIINMDYLFEDHGKRWQNFDERAYERSASKITIVATNIETGTAVTFDHPTGDHLTVALKASTAMPFITPPVATNQGKCLDGGVANSVPYDMAKKMGFDKVVVVRTRDVTYHKKPSSAMVKRLYRQHYKDYPAFVAAGIHRPIMYNQQVDTINKIANHGELFCLAPQKPVTISRLESNVNKLKALYQEGVDETTAQLGDMEKYLQDSAY